jgi:MoaA/NifB/PqqE/SkfB family radical SAM enzyme
VEIRNTALGILSSRLRGRPFYVRFQVTRRCNYRCRMCGQDHDRGDELAGKDMEAVASRLAALGARHLVLTGGEPFLRSDLPEIIAVFRARGFSIRVQTNGGPQVTEEVLARCVEAGLRDVSVSIDTLDRGLQDDICRARGVRDNALRTLSMARRLLPDSLSLANVVASSYNFDELPTLVRRFHSMGVYTYITPVMIAAEESGEDDDYRFRAQVAEFAVRRGRDVRSLHVVDELIALRRTGHGLTNSTRHLRDYRKYLETGVCTWRCEAGVLGLDVFPDGGVGICKEKPAFGNILDSGFVEAYAGGSFGEQNRSTATACSGCFYGEYREPQYAIRSSRVVAEWAVDYARTFRHGMRFNPRAERAVEGSPLSVVREASPPSAERAVRDE